MIEEKARVMVCTDCLMGIANDDYTGLDYHHTEAEANRREQDIKAGIRALELQGGQGGQLVPGDSEAGEEFSRSDCDCCGDWLAGAREECIVLGQGEQVTA